MRPLIFTAHPLYTIAFVVALLIWYIPERIGAFWLRSARDPTARKQDRGTRDEVWRAANLGHATAMADQRVHRGTDAVHLSDRAGCEAAMKRNTKRQARLPHWEHVASAGGIGNELDGWRAPSGQSWPGG